MKNSIMFGGFLLLFLLNSKAYSDPIKVYDPHTVVGIVNGVDVSPLLHGKEFYLDSDRQIRGTNNGVVAYIANTYDFRGRPQLAVKDKVSNAPLALILGNEALDPISRRVIARVTGAATPEQVGLAAIYVLSIGNHN